MVSEDSIAHTPRWRGHLDSSMPLSAAVNPVPPELWLLPRWFPFHPGKMWCHCRMVYLPMCYIYGTKATGAQCHVTRALRRELYPIDEPYEGTDWDAARSKCAKEDLYYPHPLVQDALWWTLNKAEPLLVGSRLRRAALRKVMEHIHYEDENTRRVLRGHGLAHG